MIESESRFLKNFIIKILLLPITLIQIIFRKKPFSELGEPFRLIIQFIKEAKVIFTIIILNIIIFIITMFFISEQAFVTLVSFPSDIISGNIHTLITSGFLHGDIYHLLGNMIGIFLFGRIVEREIGSKKTILVYFLALIISNIFSSLINLFILDNNIPGLGASGALMGLVATAILLNPWYITYQLILPLPIMVLGWIFIYADISGIISSAQDGIGHFAHLGGFISISIIMFFLERDNRDKIKRGLLVNIVSIVVLGIMYFALGKPSL